MLALEETKISKNISYFLDETGSHILEDKASRLIYSMSREKVCYFIKIDHDNLYNFPFSEFKTFTSPDFSGNKVSLKVFSLQNPPFSEVEKFVGTATSEGIASATGVVCAEPDHSLTNDILTKRFLEFVDFCSGHTEDEPIDRNEGLQFLCFDHDVDGFYVNEALDQRS